MTTTEGKVSTSPVTSNLGSNSSIRPKFANVSEQSNLKESQDKIALDMIVPITEVCLYVMNNNLISLKLICDAFL
jgi:hypothetical protein